MEGQGEVQVIQTSGERIWKKRHNSERRTRKFILCLRRNDLQWKCNKEQTVWKKSIWGATVCWGQAEDDTHWKRQTSRCTWKLEHTCGRAVSSSKYLPFRKGMNQSHIIQRKTGIFGGVQNISYESSCPLDRFQVYDWCKEKVINLFSVPMMGKKEATGLIWEPMGDWGETLHF